ncbi:MAG: hypothetical protein WBZ36_03400 [Candidatus Nitrosopolaris sp.]
MAVWIPYFMRHFTLSIYTIIFANITPTGRNKSASSTVQSSGGGFNILAESHIERWSSNIKPDKVTSGWHDPGSV